MTTEIRLNNRHLHPLFGLAAIVGSLAILFAEPARALDYASLEAAKAVPLPEREYLTAQDGLRLAVRHYTPASARRALVFYHGGGANADAGYQLLAQQLGDAYQTAVILPDMRGHGASEGERGAPVSKDRVWADVDTALDYAHARYPGLPVYLGGHSSGASMLLNYSQWKEATPVDGLLLIAPQLGYKSGTDRQTETPFARVSLSSFILYRLSFSLLCAQCTAVEFDYPPEIQSRANLVDRYTVQMSLAVTPNAPDDQVGALQVPVNMWIGDQDELFDPLKVQQFMAAHANPKWLNENRLVSGEGHFSILRRAGTLMGDWLVTQP